MGNLFLKSLRTRVLISQKAQLSDQVTQAVSQVAPVKTGLSKKAKIIIASVVGGDCSSGTFI